MKTWKTMKHLMLFFGACFAILSFTMPDSSRSQIFKTSLQITVRNELGNEESGANVTLYKTEEDYNNSKNPVGETKKTDGKGKVTFEGVEATAYFVQVEKGDRDNFGAGEKTPKLDQNKLNKVTIIISD